MDEINPHLPNHILLNEYYPGDGIMRHTDGQAYYPLVSTLSLNTGNVFCFWKEHSDTTPIARLYLEPRSLVVFTGDLYQNYLHSIEFMDYDCLSSDPNDEYYVNNWHLLSNPPERCAPQRDKEDPVLSLYTENETRRVLNREKPRYSLTIRYVPE